MGCLLVKGPCRTSLWFGLLRFVHTLVLLFSLLRFDIPRRVFQSQQWIVRQVGCFVIQFLSLTRLVILTFLSDTLVFWTFT